MSVAVCGDCDVKGLQSVHGVDITFTVGLNLYLRKIE